MRHRTSHHKPRPWQPLHGSRHHPNVTDGHWGHTASTFQGQDLNPGSLAPRGFTLNHCTMRSFECTLPDFHSTWHAWGRTASSQPSPGSSRGPTASHTWCSLLQLSHPWSGSDFLSEHLPSCGPLKTLFRSSLTKHLGWKGLSDTPLCRWMDWATGMLGSFPWTQHRVTGPLNPEPKLLLVDYVELLPKRPQQGWSKAQKAAALVCQPVSGTVLSALQVTSHFILLTLRLGGPCDYPQCIDKGADIQRSSVTWAMPHTGRGGGTGICSVRL